MIFREIFLTLTSPKLVFVNCKSVSGMTKSPYFLSQLKLIYLAVLSANNWCYDFDARIFNFFLVLRYFSHNFGSLWNFNTLSYFWLLHWLREDVRGIIHKIFSEKFMLWTTSTLSSRTFLLNFWILPFFVAFHSQFFIVMSFWCLMNDKYLFCFLMT